MKKTAQKSLSFILALCMIVTLLTPALSMVASAQAATLSAPITLREGEQANAIVVSFDMVDSANLLTNGGFENNMVGFSAWGGTNPQTNQIITDDVKEGTKALKISGDGFTGAFIPTIPGAVYTFTAWGKTGGANVGAPAWITLNAPGSNPRGDNILEFTETEWTEKSLTLRSTNVTQAKATAWKDPTPQFLYCDDIRFTVKQTAAGTQYYYSAKTTQADAPALNALKPEEYGTLLVSGDSLTRRYGSYLNIVEVNAEQKVVGFASLRVEIGEDEGTDTGSVQVWTTNSYVNPFQNFTKETTPMAGEAIDLLMAKSDRESAQILLRNDEFFTIKDVVFTDLSSESGSISAENFKYNFVDYHYMSNTSGQNANTTVRWGADYYPDRLSNDTERDVVAEKTQSIWITVYAPSGTAAGIYRGTATVKTTAGNYPVTITAEVLDVEIPSADKAAFDLAYWQNISGTWHWSGMSPQRYIITGIFPQIKEAGKWSDVWWKYVESAADAMEEARINVLYVQPLELLIDGGSTVSNYDNAGNAKYTFNWSKFDEFVEYFVEERGFIKKFDIAKLLNTRYASHTEPTILIANPNFDASKPADHNNRALMVEDAPQYFNNYSIPVSERDILPRAKAFFEQYIPALTQHLKEKGWLDMSYIHVEDECISTREQQEYLHMVDMFKRLSGENLIPFGDPIDTNNVDFMMQNTPVQFPLSSIFDGSKSKYEKWLAENPGTVMMYTCLNPQGNYLNKFVDKPVWQMRIQSWYSYAVDVTGHLHWAWDAGWSDAWTNGGANVGIVKNLNQFNYKGDDFIVWPDIPRGIVASSIRAASIRDGAEDYEVFYLLSQKGEDYENWAKKQVESIVRSNSSYTTDIGAMMATRALLYRAAAGEVDIFRTVTFDGNGGQPETMTAKAPVDMPLGEKMPAAPARAGYLFNGWNTMQDGSGSKFTAETVVGDDVKVFAQWVSGNDILSFAVGGVSGIVDPAAHTVTVKLAHTTALDALAPVFTLSADASSVPASGAVTDFTQPVTYTVIAGDKTEQMWTVTITTSENSSDDVTVNWNAGIATGAPAPVSVPKGSLLAMPENSMELKDYIFEGWFKDVTLEIPWDFSKNVVTGHTTLYAKWVEEFYLNDFNTETGSWVAANGAVFSAVSLVNDPDALDGKALSIRNVAQSHRAVVCTDAGKMENGTIEMRVKVTSADANAPTLGLSFRSPGKNGYYNAVSFKGGRGANRLLADANPGLRNAAIWSDPWTNATQAIQSGRYYTIKLHFYDQAITVTVDGQEIVSGDTSWSEWSTAPDYVGIYGWATTTNYTIDYIKVTPARTPEKFRVTFDSQGGGAVSAIENAMEGATITQPQTPVREGHKFLGWYKDVQGTSAWNFASDKVYTHTTLYAKWLAQSGEKEIISFALQGYEDCISTIDKYAHTVSVVLPAGTDPYLTPIVGISAGASVRPASGLAVTFESGMPYIFTVTAEDGTTQDWAVTVTMMGEDAHRVTWYANGGSPLPAQLTVEDKGSIAAPAAMTKAGYTFGGWYLDEGFTVKAQFPIEAVTEDVTLYAQWTADLQATYVFMSDTHITGSGDSARFNYAFRYIDKLLPQGYDGLVIAGDMTSDGAGNSQMKYVQQILDGYNPEGLQKYVVRGNHDPISAMETLSEELYPASYYHAEMGGYHFLMCDSNNFDTNQQTWLSAELSKVVNASGYRAGEPIFVVMHAPLSGTVLGSNQSFSSSAAVYNILSKYPQVVVLSGHSHRDVLDDRSIFQKDFTSVNLGSMQYIEYDSGRIEGDIPAQTGLVHEDGSQSQMNQAVIATVYSDRIAFDRYDFSVDKHLGTWEIALPLMKESFAYTASSRDKEAPVFAESDAISLNMTSSSEVEFTYPQATDNAFVYDYKIDLKQGNTTVKSILTFSQFYAAKMPATKTNAFAGLTPETQYTLEITARDSVGNASARKLTMSFSTTAEGALGVVNCEDPSFNLSRPRDVMAQVSGEDVALHSLRYGDTALKPGRDYTMDGNQVIISKDYLKQFGAGATVILSFVFNQGDPTELAIQLSSDKQIVRAAMRDFEDGSLEGLMSFRQAYTLGIQTASPLAGEKSLQITTGRNGKQMLIDTNVPKVSDGILEFDVKPVGGDFGAMAFIIRGTDGDNHLALGCDGAGDWLWINHNAGVETFALLAKGSVPLRSGVTYHIKISFYGDNYELYVDNTCVIRTVIPGLIQDAGYFGIHNWGSTSRGVVIDNVKLTYAEDVRFYDISVVPLKNGSIIPSKMSAEADEIITLSVIPEVGYRLVAGSLKVNGEVVEGDSFSMPTEDAIITAVFERIPLDTLKIQTAPNLTLKKGATLNLGAAVFTAPTEAVVSLVFASSNPAVVSANANGVLYGLKTGTAIVTVKDLNSGAVVAVMVTVS